MFNTLSNYVFGTWYYHAAHTPPKFLIISVYYFLAITIIGFYQNCYISKSIAHYHMISLYMFLSLPLISLYVLAFPVTLWSCNQWCLSADSPHFLITFWSWLIDLVCVVLNWLMCATLLSMIKARLKLKRLTDVFVL